MDPVPRTAVNLALEALLNKTLALDPISPQRLAAWEGKSLALQLTRPELQFVLRMGLGQVRVETGQEGEPDAHVRGSALQLLRFLTPAIDHVNAQDMPEITGQIALAEAFQDLLRDLDPDWEAELAKFLGDVVAHEAGRRIRQGFRWSLKTSFTLWSDLEEYLAEEARLVPKRTEVDYRFSELTQLDTRIDGLEQRIEQLRLKLQPQNHGSTAEDLTNADTSAS